MYSLRRTLAVRFSSTMLLALLLIGLVAFLGTRRVLSGQLDRGLAAALSLEGATLAAGQPIAPQNPWVDYDVFVRDVNRFVVVRDTAGNILSGNTPIVSGLPLDPAGFARARRGIRTFSTHRWRDQRVRSVFAPTPEGALGEPGVIQVTASLEPQERIYRLLFAFMVVTVILTTAATAGGAGWLAHSAVTPVQEITDQADAITPGTADGRITAHADVQEYHNLVRVLNDMLQRLEDGIRSQRRMIADVGHDLRTPITALRGELEVALRIDRHPVEYQRILRSSLEEVDRLELIGETAVLLARLESDDLELEPTPTPLRPLAAAAIERAQRDSDGRRIDLVDTAGATGSVSADGKMLAMVFDHLLDNILQHTPPDTIGVVTISNEPDHLVLLVDDDGPGVPADALPHLFERFYRGDAARARSAGPGLGLTIAAAIVHAHRGTIRAARSKLGGLCVQVRLPKSVAATGHPLRAGHR